AQRGAPEDPRAHRRSAPPGARVCDVDSAVQRARDARDRADAAHPPREQHPVPPRYAGFSVIALGVPERYAGWRTPMKAQPKPASEATFIDLDAIARELHAEATGSPVRHVARTIVRESDLRVVVVA